LPSEAPQLVEKGGGEVGHGFTERTTFVVSPDGTIAAAIDGYVAYRLLGETALADEVAEMRLLIAQTAPDLYISPAVIC